MKEFIFEFGGRKFHSNGHTYRSAVRNIKAKIQKTFKAMPSRLPLLVMVKLKEKDGYRTSYWDIREFFKEAGIKIDVSFSTPPRSIKKKTGGDVNGHARPDR